MIGIFGGTFDPVHYGHLETIQFVRKTLNLEHVRLIPLGQAVHRQQPIASAQQRLEMLQAAIAEQEGLVVDEREINRPGGSYTVDTLESIHQDFPGKSLCLVIGSDAFKEFETWKAPEKILSLANLAVMQRPDNEINDFHSDFIADLLKTRQVASSQELHNHNYGKIIFVKVPQIDTSSTMIREKLLNKQPINLLVPASVEKLIRQWHLYQ